MFEPRVYGIDLYGDNLCTSKRHLAQHPARVQAFRAASLKGWAYALAHKEEIVDLIRRKYSAQKASEALLFEAERMELLIKPHLVPIGDQSTERWKTIAEIYVSLGMASEAELPDGLIYAPEDGWRLLVQAPLLLAVLTSFLVCALRWILYRHNIGVFSAMRLSTAMTALFVLLSIPVLIFILTYNYRQNAAAISSTLSDVVAKTKQARIEDAENLINPVAATLFPCGDRFRRPGEFQDGGEPESSLPSTYLGLADRRGLCQL